MKEYLGDGVYVDFDGHQVELTTENGIHATNRIFLDAYVYDQLTKYTDRLKLRDKDAAQPAGVDGPSAGQADDILGKSHYSAGKGGVS